MVLLLVAVSRSAGLLMNQAVSGESARMGIIAKPTTTVTIPSRMKNQDQPARFAMPSMLKMAEASNPEQAPESAAATNK